MARLRSWGTWALRLALSGLILWWVLRRIPISAVGHALGGSSLPPLLAALALALAMNYTSAARVWILLIHQDLNVSSARVGTLNLHWRWNPLRWEVTSDT